MIREVEALGLKLSTYFSPVTLFDGAIGDYVGLGIFVTSAEYTGSAGQGIVDVDFQINMRSRDVAIGYSIIGFLARYPGIVGPITFDKGPPQSDLGAAEAALGATLHCDLVYPEAYIDLSGVTTDTLTITYVHGEDVLGTSTTKLFARFSLNGTSNWSQMRQSTDGYVSLAVVPRIALFGRFADNQPPVDDDLWSDPFMVDFDNLDGSEYYLAFSLDTTGKVIFDDPADAPGNPRRITTALGGGRPIQSILIDELLALN